jgi:hypothetical protein
MLQRRRIWARGAVFYSLRRCVRSGSIPIARSIFRRPTSAEGSQPLTRWLPTVLLRQVLPDNLNHAVGSRTRWEKP